MCLYKLYSASGAIQIVKGTRLLTSGTISAFYGPIIAVVSGTVTDITGGAVWQKITLRLTSGVVITHNSAKIRLKVLVNVAGTSANDMLHLVNISGIWFETGRSF